VSATAIAAIIRPAKLKPTVRILTHTPGCRSPNSTIRAYTRTPHQHDPARLTLGATSAWPTSSNKWCDAIADRALRALAVGVGNGVNHRVLAEMAFLAGGLPQRQARLTPMADYAPWTRRRI